MRKINWPFTALKNLLGWNPVVSMSIVVTIELTLLFGLSYAHKAYDRNRRWGWRHDVCDLIDNDDPLGSKWMACEQAKTGCPIRYQNGDASLQTYIDADGREYCVDGYGRPIKDHAKN